MILLFKQRLRPDFHLGIKGFMNYVLALLFISTSAFSQSSVEKGKKLWENKKPAEAKKLLLTIYEDSKDYAEAQFYLGRIAYDEKDFESAEDFFEEAVDADDIIAMSYGNLSINILSDIMSC